MRKIVILMLLLMLLCFYAGYIVGSREGGSASSQVATTEPAAPAPQPSHKHRTVKKTNSSKHAKKTTERKQTTTPTAKSDVATREIADSVATIDNAFNQSAVTMQSFSQDYTDFQATVTLHNNTDRTITSVSARIVFRSMTGEVLDYEDKRWHIVIDPGMSKPVTMRSYGHSDFYAYYKSQLSYSHSDRKFKVDFTLVDYTTR